jgi:hypothetical protein
MAYLARPSDFQAPIAHRRPATAVNAVKAPARPGLLRRAFNAFIEGRQRRMRPQIDRYIAWHSRGFTDSFEREIGARMFTGDWNIRR